MGSAYRRSGVNKKVHTKLLTKGLFWVAYAKLRG